MLKHDQKVCLITGASSGIGKEVALGLLKSGAYVIMIGRDVERTKLAYEEIKQLSHSNSIDMYIADLSSQDSIRLLVKKIKERYSYLNVLINNAAVVLTKKELTSDGYEMTLATNYLGPFLLTNLLIDLLKKSGSARVVNISSAIHKWAKLDVTDLNYNQRKYQCMKAYAQSKLLMNLMTYELADKLNGEKISVNCIHPGAVKTNLGSNNVKNLGLELFDKLIKALFISPTKAAKFIIDLTISPQFEKMTGRYFTKKGSYALTYPKSLSNEIWQLSEKMTILGK